MDDQLVNIDSAPNSFLLQSKGNHIEVLSSLTNFAQSPQIALANGFGENIHQISPWQSKTTKHNNHQYGQLKSQEQEKSKMRVDTRETDSTRGPQHKTSHQ